ncbi:hypothetical protein [Agriterribacter sp.]|uniref:hypothetical protein n=1 Tax=Agriterribacter sp. TaxID=2821509 RepID=UPI002BE133A5|nr:hypothetical protein [Agriterribacter sp.]HTN09137.1 hypothetical protein [Agriterribacter sp.]
MTLPIQPHAILASRFLRDKARKTPTQSKPSHPPPGGRNSYELHCKPGQDNYHQQPNEVVSNILAKNFGNSKKAAKFDKIVKVKISRP